MKALTKSHTLRFLKIYGIVVVLDLFAYLLIFYAGQALPSHVGSSFPGNYGLCIYWISAHYPTDWIYRHSQSFPDKFLWILIFQDAWWAGLILLFTSLWKRTATNDSHPSAQRQIQHDQN